MSVLAASVEASQVATAVEAEIRAKLQQQLTVALESAAEFEAKEKAGAAENEKLRMLLMDATREVQAASEGSTPLLPYC